MPCHLLRIVHDQQIMPDLLEDKCSLDEWRRFQVCLEAFNRPPLKETEVTARACCTTYCLATPRKHFRPNPNHPKAAEQNAEKNRICIWSTIDPIPTYSVCMHSLCYNWNCHRTKESESHRQPPNHISGKGAFLGYILTDELKADFSQSLKSVYIAI